MLAILLAVFIGLGTVLVSRRQSALPLWARAAGVALACVILAWNAIADPESRTVSFLLVVVGLAWLERSRKATREQRGPNPRTTTPLT